MIGTAGDEPPSSEDDEAGVPLALEDSGAPAVTGVEFAGPEPAFAPFAAFPPWPPFEAGVSGPPEPEPEGVGEPEGFPSVEDGEVCEDPPLGAPTESPAWGGVLLPVAVGGASVY